MMRRFNNIIRSSRKLCKRNTHEYDIDMANTQSSSYSPVHVYSNIPFPALVDYPIQSVKLAPPKFAKTKSKKNFLMITTIITILLVTLFGIQLYFNTELLNE
jgi:hypothetical protein